MRIKQVKVVSVIKCEWLEGFVSNFPLKKTPKQTTQKPLQNSYENLGNPTPFLGSLECLETLREKIRFIALYAIKLHKSWRGFVQNDYV